jgi:hypothetical protein
VKVILTTESGEQLILIERLAPEDFESPASEWLMAQLREAIALRKSVDEQFDRLNETLFDRELSFPVEDFEL